MRRYFIHLLTAFPDRMAEPRWLGRCRLEGAEYLLAARQAGRPVVLVFFHFGPIYVMRQWLRAHGFPVSVYIDGNPESRGRVESFEGSLTPFPGVPLAFFPGELRKVMEFLKAGNILFMAVDMRGGQRTIAETADGWTTTINSGAARLAAQTDADLLVATIVNEGFWRFRIKFSPPILAAQLQTRDQLTTANRQLLLDILPDFKRYPDQFIVPIVWQPAKNAGC